MSSYYLLPANLNFKRVQSIPFDIQNKIFQNNSGVNAAEKIQELNSFFYNGTEAIPSTITTTVAQILAQDPDVDYVTDPLAPLVPAYRVHVHGWTNVAVTAEPEGPLNIIGGFPRSFNSNQLVNNAKTSVVLPQGTLTAYAEEPAGDTVTPHVVILSDNTVTLTDINSTPSDPFPNWSVSIDIPYPGVYPSFMEFDFSFNLFIEPQFTYA